MRGGRVFVFTEEISKFLGEYMRLVGSEKGKSLIKIEFWGYRLVRVSF